METALMICVSLMVGLAIGILSGLLGIGGGTLMVPIFKLGYLMEPIVCTATSLFTIIPTSLSGAVAHVRKKTCVPKLGLAAGLGGMVTSPLGVWLATISPGWAIMTAAAAVILYSAFTMFRKAMNAPKRSGERNLESARRATSDAAPSGDAPSPDAPASEAAAAADTAAALAELAPAFKPGIREMWLGFAIGVTAGVVSGYVGVGGGFIMVPLMMSLLKMPMKLTSGTSLIAVMLLAIPGVVMQALLGNVSWVAGIAVAAGSIPGALLGARLMTHVPERTLRFMFAGFLVIAGVVLALSELGIF